MYTLLENENWSLYVCLNLMKFFGFLVPGTHSSAMKRFLRVYWTFWFTFIFGIYIIVQFGDLIQIWGDLPLMVNTSFLLFTNCALAAKIITLGWRSKVIQRIIDENDREVKAEDTEEGKLIIKKCEQETSILFLSFAILACITVLGWAASAEKNRLPFSAWYPYDAYRSPAYEITYAHQSIAIFLGAALNVGVDAVITTLIALCTCRLKLTAIALKNLCNGIEINKNQLATADQEAIIESRLRVCAVRHQTALQTAEEVQACFSEPILGQLSVSTVIICVSAYQMAIEVHNTSKNVVRIIAMTTYLLGMILQVFMYCYQGNQISVESSEISYAAYQCPWYSCSLKFRRSLLLVMVRSRKMTILTAGGITILSLATFTSIIKASYSFFTVLKQVEDRKA